MFSCSACLRRAFQSLLSDFPASTSFPSSEPLLAVRRPFLQRSFSSTPPSPSTLRALSKGHHRRTYLEARRDLAQERRNAPPGTQHFEALGGNTRRNKARERPVDRRNRLAVEKNSKHLVVGGDKEIQIAAAKEAEWINDPLRLATRVLTYLRDDNEQGTGFEQALELVRASEKHSLRQGHAHGALNNIVSWNHLMDWCMSRSDPRSAVQIYNEMKKRGHKPDAHSYTIMLRGFAVNLDKPNVARDAMRVYEGSQSLNSDVKPNTTHLNAAINVFARLGDMDSMWNILSRARERGQGSPDALTFTIVLNAIQKDIINKAASVLSKHKGADTGLIFQTAIRDGRKVWADAVVKWREAELNVDESLVCAMGRLLLMSKTPKDHMDVFMLVQQTMRIAIPREPVERKSEQMSFHDVEEEEKEALQVFEHKVEHDEDQAVASKSSPRQELNAVEGPARSLYATPGNNTLSMLLEAATITHQLHIGKAYWELLTKENGPFAIKPDVQNVTAYMRLLRVSRSSKSVAEIMQKEWPEQVTERLYSRGNFVVAMSTCVRDKNNPDVFQNASSILDVMQRVADKKRQAEIEQEEKNIEADTGAQSRSRRIIHDRMKQKKESRGEMLDMDPKVMAMYLNLAMFTTRGINKDLPMKKLKSGDLDFERTVENNNTFKALKQIGANASNVLRMLKNRLAESERQALPARERIEMEKHKKKYWLEYDKTAERLEDLVGLMRALISCYDRVLVVNEVLEDRGMGPLDGQLLDEIKINKAQFGRYLGMVDGKLIKKMELGKRSGLWEGYDPVKQAAIDRATARQGGMAAATNREGATDATSTTSTDDTVPDTTYGRVDAEGNLIDTQYTPSIFASTDPEANSTLPTPSAEMEENVKFLYRVPASASIEKEVNKQVKINQTTEENRERWLSKRQKQEKEKYRRRDRRDAMSPDSGDKPWEHERYVGRRFDGRRLGGEGGRSPGSSEEQSGWGGGFEAMAERMGRKESSQLVDN